MSHGQAGGAAAGSGGGGGSWGWIPSQSVVHHVHSGCVHVHHDSGSGGSVDLAPVLARLDAITTMLEEIMSSQDDVDAAVAQIGLDVTGLTDAGVRIEAAIAALEAQGADTTALRAAISSLDDAVGSVASIVPPPTGS